MRRETRDEVDREGAVDESMWGLIGFCFCFLGLVPVGWLTM